ncbi:MAG: hypothetical protein R3305_11870, partial [Gammaproteobacteria bacterium]|nr:hypothetical protein [Gammaproteobacteria bacterium]
MRLVLAAVLIGTVLALPNIATEPALRISSEDGSAIPRTTVDVMTAQLARDGTASFDSAISGGALSLRFDDEAQRRTAADDLAASFPGYVVAFTTEPRLPVWLRALGLRPVSLGLDLTGGVQFVYEVELGTVTERLLTDRLTSAQRALRDADIRHTGDIDGDRVTISVAAGEDVDAARAALLSLRGPALPDSQFALTETEAGDAREFTLTIPDQVIAAERVRAMQQNIVTLRNRVNELGLSEPVVVSMGSNRILVQIPGAR